MGKKENESSKNDSVMTPANIYGPVLEALGIERFDLDPCSHPRAVVPVRTRIMLPEYQKWEYTLSAGDLGELPGHPPSEQRIYGDGLTYPWDGDVWKNPPYSQLQYSVPTKKNPQGKYPWFYKLVHEAKRGVAFLPSRTSSGWWHRWVLEEPTAHILVQLKGRVKHHGEQWGSPFHQVLVAYNVFAGADDLDILDDWVEVFRGKGFVSSLRAMREAV